jgi:hypothetical protein
MSTTTQKTTKQPKLTAEQRRRVRELIEDEGNTRAEAVAYVLMFEPAQRQETHQ